MLEDSKLTAADIMTRDVVTVFPHTSIRYAAKLLGEHRISGMPVVDVDRRVVGMITENDLLQWSGGLGDKQAWWLEILAEGYEAAPGSPDLVRVEGEKVRGVMAGSIIAIAEDMPVTDIAKVMVEHGVKRVPVLRDGRLMGIVSRADLVRALARG